MNRKSLCGGSALAAIMLVCATGAPALAQDAAQQPAEVSEVVITGSFIAGTPEDAALPVDVIGTKELEQRGSPSVVQFIKTIPSSGAVIGENNRFGGGNGTATVNLRNLNSPSTGARTLVLFNGRRVATTRRALGSVDINQLPSSAIGRVEVLKDGAAATYGSDAIGGVVNFITRNDLDGFEISGQYQAIKGSTGDYEVGAAWGWQGDRGSSLITLDYHRRNELSVHDRDWSLRTGPEGYLENPLGGWAGTGNPGQYNYPTTAPVGSPDTGFTSASFTGALPDIGCAANGGSPYALTTAIPVPTYCNFQYTTLDNLVEDENRYQAYGQLDFDLTDNVTFHGEVSFARSETPHQSWSITGPNQSPTPILASGASIGGGVSPVPATGSGEQSRFYIPASNPGLIALIGQIGAADCNGPVLPYGVDAASCGAGLALARAGATNAAQYGVVSSDTRWRPIGFAGNPYTSDRHSHYTYNTDNIRVVGELKGKFDNGIGWDASMTFQELDYEYNLQDTAVNRLQLGLRGYGSRAGDPNQCTASETGNFSANAGNAALGCYYFNPFTNAMQRSLAEVGDNPYYIADSSIPGFNDAAANRGKVFDWMEEEQYNHDTSRLFVADFVLNGPTPWKLWADDTIAWAVGAQFRYDREIRNPDTLYDTQATPCVDSPPFGDGSPFCPTTQAGPFLFNANLTPFDVDRKIYATFAEVRVPILDNLELTLAGRYENYAGQGDTFNPKVSLRYQALDWLAFRGTAGSTYRAPTATLTTDTFSRGLTNASGTYRSNDLYGNPDLDPEKANTYDVGVIFNFPRFTATVDYWLFDFKNPLTSETTADLISLFFPTALGDAGRCGDPAYAGLQNRFTFASGTCGKSSILGYRTQYINGGAIKTSGIDFQANLDVGDIFGGALTTGFDGTYLIKYDEDPYFVEGHATSEGTVERAGTYRASLFTGYNRLRANAYVNWASGRHNLRWQLRHVSSVTQSEALANALANNVHSTAKVAEYWQSDFIYKVELPWDATATLSVLNVFDEDPPFAIGTQYNYDPGSGNPLGRVYSIGLKKRF